MGSMSLSNHYRSEDLLDIETAAGGFQQRKGMKQCLPLTFCFHTGLSQYMALESTEGRTRSEIFYHCPVRTLSLSPSSSSPYCKNNILYSFFLHYSVAKMPTYGAFLFFLFFSRRGKDFFLLSHYASVFWCQTSHREIKLTQTHQSEQSALYAYIWLAHHRLPSCPRILPEYITLHLHLYLFT